MSTENKEDLFELKLTEVGRNYILKSARVLGVSIALSLIMSAFQLFSYAFQVTRISSIETQRPFWQTYQVAGMLNILALIFNLVALFKFYSFVSGLKKSIVRVDEERFSLSFRHLFANIIFFLIALIVHMIAAALYIVGPLGALF